MTTKTRSFLAGYEELGRGINARISVKFPRRQPTWEFQRLAFLVGTTRRIDHRQQLQEVRAKLKSNPVIKHVIVAGDFNSVARDGAFSGLPDSLSDTFRISGAGWGGTGANDYPIFRVDQIWASDSIQPQAVVSQKTKHSDHRMVVGDLLFDDIP